MAEAKTPKTEQGKIKQYINLGFTEYQARRLLDTGLNISVIADTLKKGCPINVAYRIYRP